MLRRGDERVATTLAESNDGSINQTARAESRARARARADSLLDRARATRNRYLP